MGKESSVSSEQSKDAQGKSGPVAASSAAPVTASESADSANTGSGEHLKRIRLWHQFIQ